MNRPVRVRPTSVGRSNMTILKEEKQKRRPEALTRSGLRLGQDGTTMLTLIGHFDKHKLPASLRSDSCPV